MRYFIGIDGGASKTAYCAAGENDSFLRYERSSGASWREHGAENVARKFRETVNNLMAEKQNQIAGIAIGLPCYGESSGGDQIIEEAIRGEFPGIPIYFTNDVEAGWAGSMALVPGINIVAGTGAIAFGKDAHGNRARSGGWSEFFGDEGSCYWIGRKLMEVFSKQADGRIPRDELYPLVYKELKLKDDYDFIDIVHSRYIGFRKNVADLQYLAEKAALAGSPSIKALYKEAVMELCLLVDAVRGKLDFSENPVVVSYSGGLFKARDLILLHFSAEIEKRGGTLAPPCFEPWEGAMLLAFQHFNPAGLDRILKLLWDSRENKGKPV